MSDVEKRAIYNARNKDNASDISISEKETLYKAFDDIQNRSKKIRDLLNEKPDVPE